MQTFTILRFDFTVLNVYHKKMIQIDSKLIEQAVYNLCIKANTSYDSSLYNLILKKYESAFSAEDKIKYSNILKNIKLAFDTKRPLCQDTGQVIVFIKAGQNVAVENGFIIDSINEAVKKAYTQNFYRKSVVKNSIFNRINTQTNTPVLIYTDIIKEDVISIDLMIKGAGSENCSTIKMFKPSANKFDIFDFIKDTVVSAGEKSCPPLVLGIGAGGTMEYASILSKKSFFHNENFDEQIFIQELKEYLKDCSDNILDIHLMTSATHIACMPVAVTVNCHSTRHASCRISATGIEYLNNNAKYQDIDFEYSGVTEIFASDIEKIKSLKKGENFLLTGEIYTARDAAHKKFKEYFNTHGKLPLDFENKIIFYAGPCPAADGEIIGPTGPTTSTRMDEYCDLMYSNKLLATIGKGERTGQAADIINRYNGKYFTAQGGIACLLAKCVKSNEIVFYEELGTEAVRKLYVEKLPLKVVI